MKSNLFSCKKIGGTSTKGKPLYIALHGGGSSFE